MVQTAKVYVYKDEEAADLPWLVAAVYEGDMTIIHHESETFREAWQWLYENYVRETP